MTNDNRFTKPPAWNTPFTDEKSSIHSPDNTPEPIPDVTLPDLVERSAKFPVKFPVESVRCYQLLETKIPREVLERNINSAYPVIHEHALQLCTFFLKYHKRFGNHRFYKDMSLLQLVDRLLRKRAVSFVGTTDQYLLLDGSSGSNCWENVGSAKETKPLVLENCLSYEEIKLSNLLSVSSYTCFVNDGNTSNLGVVEENRDKVEEVGVIVGLSGPRLNKENVMEYREIMKTPEQNTHIYGYGQFLLPTLQGIFSSFYGDACICYDTILNLLEEDERYIDLGDGKYFDQVTYARRITLTIDTLLIEANHRAKQVGKMAYVHVVGWGLGAWKIYSGQDKIFLNTFAERIKFISLTNISDICFSHKMAGAYQDGDVLRGIRLHFRDRNPHDKLEGPDSGKLLVVSYSANGNTLPGNEFWTGNFDASSSSAAASSTQLAELHNCHINDKVSAWNLRVATLEGSLVTFEEYRQMTQTK